MGACQKNMGSSLKVLSVAKTNNLGNEINDTFYGIITHRTKLIPVSSYKCNSVKKGSSCRRILVNRYRSNEENTKSPLGKDHSNNCCRQGPLVDAKISILTQP